MTIATSLPRDRTAQLRPDSLVDGLRDPDGWGPAAARLLADLGFTLINSHRGAAALSHLLIALRDHPSLAHFDPELVSYYEPADDRGQLVTLDRRTAGTEPVRTVLWGHVHLVDRLGIENRFLTFGGELRTAEVDPDTTILDLRSPGPIVRWGGHSQGADELAGEIGAFFGRLIVPVDLRPGAESRIDGLPPEVLYAAFVLDLSARLASARAHGSSWSELDGWLSVERLRLRADAGAWLAAKLFLADHMLGS
jgi:hypothetical protein